MEATKEILLRISAEEMVDALGMKRAPQVLRAPVRLVFSALSSRLASTLVKFDADVGRFGVAEGAARALTAFGVSWTKRGSAPKAGPLLVVSNHPGAYDAFLLLAAIERDDVRIVAADRSFLRALPNLARHLILVPEAGAPLDRVGGVRRALRHLAVGGALLHFGAGRIEPDPDFVSGVGEILEPWRPGTAVLARAATEAGGVVVPALVRGVHSVRAKELLVTRLAERRGITTLAPLLQIALPGFREVSARVELGAPVLAGAAKADALTAAVRSAVRALHAPAPPRRR